MIGSVANPLADKARLTAFAAPLVAIVATVIVIGNPRYQAGALEAATPLLLVAGLVFGVLVIRFSATGTAALVAFIYLDLSEALVRYHFPSLLQLLVVALAFAAWLKRDTASVREVLLQPLTLAIAAWLAMAFVSTAWAGDRAAADMRFGDLLKAFALYLLATALMRSRRRLMQGVAAFLVSAALLSLLATYQFVTGQTSRSFGGFGRYEEAQIYEEVFQPRAAGPVGDPNFFAQILLIAVPVAVLLGFFARRRWSRIAMLGVAAVVLFAIALTYSRGGMLAVAVMAVLMLRPLHVHWKNTVLAAIGALLVLLVLPSGVTKRFVTLEQVLPVADEDVRADSSIAERRVYMAVAAAMFAQHPMEGVGIGNYPVEYDEYIGDVASSARLYPRANPMRYPHNLFLEIAAETGLIGLALFGTVVIAVWRALRRSERAFSAAGDRELANLAIALRISFIGFLVASVFLHLAVPRYLFLLLAFAASAQRIEEAG